MTESRITVDGLIDESARLVLKDFCSGLPEKLKTLIKIVNLTNRFYVVFDEDAKLVAKDTHGNDDCLQFDEYIGLKYLLLDNRQFELAVRDILLVKQYSVEVYFFNESNTLKLKYNGSPGNLLQFEDILFSKNTNILTSNLIIAVKLSEKDTIAISFIDLNEFQISFYQFLDDEFGSHFEKVLIQTNPKECLLFNETTKDFIHFERIKKILERNSISLTFLDKFTTKIDENQLKSNIETILFFEQNQEKNFNIIEKMFEISKDCLICLSVLMQYLNVLSNEYFFDKFRIVKLDFLHSVYLNTAAIRGLNLLQDKNSCSSFNEISNTRKRNLYDLLNNCCTNQGKRLLDKWIRQPLLDWKQINNRLNCVEEFIKHQKIIYDLRSSQLNSLPDFLQLVHKIYRKNSKLKHLFRIYQGILQTKTIFQSIQEFEFFDQMLDINDIFVKPFFEYLNTLKKFVRLIEDNIDMDLAANGEYLLNSKENPELIELKSQLISFEKDAESQYENVISALSGDYDGDSGDLKKFIKLDSSDLHKFNLRIPIKKESLLKSKSAQKFNFKIIDSTKTAIRFANVNLLELGDEYKSVMREYEVKQEEMLKEIMQISIKFCPKLILLNSLIAKFDILLSFAFASLIAPIQYVRPILLIDENDENVHRESSDSVRYSRKRYLKISQARHPCIEIQDNVSFIPNDVYFEEGSNNFHIITGPNMAGKSTYIRTIGVITLMAHIGCFVPCDLAEIPIFDSIHARIGSSDSLGKGLSTFMVEMTEMASILQNCTSKSLVIIDELCRGTSTYEGVGLAWSIAKKLAADVGSFSLFATHFHEITDLAFDLVNVHNFHTSVLVENEQLIFMYQIKSGFMDRSFGIQVAKMIGFPDEIVNDAIRIQKELEIYPDNTFPSDFKMEQKREIIRQADGILIDFFEKVKQFLLKKDIVIEKNSDILNYLTEDVKKFIFDLRTEMNLDSNLLIKTLLNRD